MLTAAAGGGGVPFAHASTLVLSEKIHHPYVPETISGLSDPAYDIEAIDDYCTGGGSACIPTGHTPAQCANWSIPCPGYTVANAQFYGPDNGSTAGTPYEVYLSCTNDTVSSQQYGVLDVVSPAGYAAYGYGVHGEAVQGAIGGKATLLSWYANNDEGTSEESYSQASSASLSVAIPMPREVLITANAVRGTVTGVQNTDNVNDLPISGGFSITLTGYLWTYWFTGPNAGTVTYPWSTINCFAGGPHAADIYNALGYIPPYAEGELETTLGESSP